MKDNVKNYFKTEVAIKMLEAAIPHYEKVDNEVEGRQQKEIVDNGVAFKKIHSKIKELSPTIVSLVEDGDRKAYREKHPLMYAVFGYKFHISPVIYLGDEVIKILDLLVEEQSGVYYHLPSEYYHHTGVTTERKRVRLYFSGGSYVDINLAGQIHTYIHYPVPSGVLKSCLFSIDLNSNYVHLSNEVLDLINKAEPIESALDTAVCKIKEQYDRNTGFCIGSNDEEIQT